MHKSRDGETEEIASNVKNLTVGSQSGRLLYYDIGGQRYHLYNTDNGEDSPLAPGLSMYKPVISPDGRSILYQNIVSYSGQTDDERDYYRALDLVTNKITTIYSGYRAWLGYIW